MPLPAADQPVNASPRSTTFRTAAVERAHPDTGPAGHLVGRAEIIAGRSAFAEPFALFGVRMQDYDAVFAEKLGLLLRLRAEDRVSWSGRFRPPLDYAPIAPRAVQPELPIWAGVGGSGCTARAGLLGLPMVLGYIGGPLGHAKRFGREGFATAPPSPYESAGPSASTSRPHQQPSVGRCSAYSCTFWSPAPTTPRRPPTDSST